jgi:hypothetical protein
LLGKKIVVMLARVAVFLSKNVMLVSKIAGKLVPMALQNLI